MLQRLWQRKFSTKASLTKEVHLSRRDRLSRKESSETEAIVDANRNHDRYETRISLEDEQNPVWISMNPDNRTISSQPTSAGRLLRTRLNLVVAGCSSRTAVDLLASGYVYMLWKRKKLISRASGTHRGSKRNCEDRERPWKTNAWLLSAPTEKRWNIDGVRESDSLWSDWIYGFKGLGHT